MSEPHDATWTVPIWGDEMHRIKRGDGAGDAYSGTISRGSGATYKMIEYGCGCEWQMSQRTFVIIDPRCASFKRCCPIHGDARGGVLSRNQEEAVMSERVDPARVKEALDGAMNMATELRFYQATTAVLFWALVIAMVGGHLPWVWGLAWLLIAFSAGYVTRWRERDKQREALREPK